MWWKLNCIGWQLDTPTACRILGKIFKMEGSWKLSFSCFSLTLPSWGTEHSWHLVNTGLCSWILSCPAQSRVGLHWTYSLPAIGWWEIVALCHMVWVPDCSYSLALRAAHWCIGGQVCLWNPRMQAAIGSRAPWTEFPAQLAAVIWKFVLAQGEGGSCGEAREMVASQVCAPERGRECPELERWKSICIAALDSKRAEKMDNGLLAWIWISVFWEEEDFCILHKVMAWSWGTSISPKLGTLLIKAFFFPHQLLCYTCVLQQVAESHFGQ